MGADFQLGAARVFVREALHRALERARADKLRAAATLLQARMRGYLARLVSRGDPTSHGLVDIAVSSFLK